MSAILIIDTGSAPNDNTGDDLRSSFDKTNANFAALNAEKADLVGGVIPSSQIPAIAITEFLGSVSGQPDMLVLNGEKGDWCIRTDLSTIYVITGNNPSLISSWTAMPSSAGAIISVNGKTGVIVISKADVGLSNVDNTSDANKPISASVAAALLDKVDYSFLGNLATVATTGDYKDLINKPTIPPTAPVDSVSGKTGAVTLELADLTDVDSTVSAPSDGDILVYRSAGSGFVLEKKPATSGAPDWGDITGTLSNQTDLQTALSGKATAAQGALADSAQQPPSEGAFVNGDKTKLDGIEAAADVTDTANVTAAGALMDSEVTNLAQVKAFDSADYATAAQGAKADTALQSLDVAIRTITGTTDTLVLSDAHKYLRYTNAASVTATVPANASVAFPNGTVITMRQAGAGQVTLAAGAGVTLNGNLKTAEQHASIQIIKVDTDVWDVTGGVA